MTLEDERKTTEDRLVAIDVLRGTLLTVVLVDHVDSLTPSPIVAQWTLMGLGHSDAADLFVFLSGFVFGYVYSNKISLLGISCGYPIAKRAISIYLGFLACSGVVGFINIISSNLSWQFQLTLWSKSLLLSWHEANTAILALFVVLLPLIFVLELWIGRRSRVAMLLVSITIYCISQFVGSSAFPDWLFQPFSWQLPMALGSVWGYRYRSLKHNFIPRNWTLFVAASSVLTLSLIVRKFGDCKIIADLETTLFSSSLVSKSTWAPVRALHHLSLLYFILFFFRLDSSTWSFRVLRPLRVCGMHSLKFYCIGVVITKLCQVTLQSVGADSFMKAIAMMDAVVLQFMIAAIVSRRYLDST